MPLAFYILTFIGVFILLWDMVVDGTLGTPVKRILTLKFDDNTSTILTRLIERFESNELKIDYSKCDENNIVLTNGSVTYYICSYAKDSRAYGWVANTKFILLNDGDLQIQEHNKWTGAINTSAYRKVSNLVRTVQRVRETEVL